MPSPTRADAFDAGRCYSRWEAEVRRSEEIRRSSRMLSVQLPDHNLAMLGVFFKNLQLDQKQLRARILQYRKPVRTPEGGVILYYDPSAKDAVDEAVGRAGLAIAQWFSIGEQFSAIEKGFLAKDGRTVQFKSSSSFRRKMEDAGVNRNDRDSIDAQLREAIATTTDVDALKDAFDRVAEHLRDCARALEPVSEKVMDSSARPPSPTTVEKLVFLLVVLVFAAGGFYLFSATWWLVFLWLAFFVVALPLVWVFLFRAEEVPGGDLLRIYQTGVQSIPLIGRVLAPSPSEEKSKQNQNGSG